MKFSYQAKKLSTAHRALMLPHTPKTKANHTQAVSRFWQVKLFTSGILHLIVFKTLHSGATIQRIKKTFKNNLVTTRQSIHSWI